MGPRGGTNSKVQAAMEKMNANKAIKDAQEAALRAQQEAKDWQKGSNTRKQNKMENAASKADEAARKKREKAALLQAEEESNGGGSGKVKSISGMQKKQMKKKKAGNNFSMLEDSLVSAAETKTRAQKRSARLKREKEEQKQKEIASKKANEDSKLDPLLANTNAMIGDLEDDGGRKANIERGKNSEGSGLDGAMQALSIGNSTEDQHPEKRVKALHKAYEERMLVQMKQDYPGLKLSQYKDKIFTLWKKSPENPMNQLQRP